VVEPDEALPFPIKLLRKGQSETVLFFSGRGKDWHKEESKNWRRRRRKISKTEMSINGVRSIPALTRIACRVISYHTLRLHHLHYMCTGYWT
jgi:hypothetical protein